ncbi:MAG: hypothetical protein IPP17_27300 [Bacteroidetes bacterium]|nr:hypothetical protein [Bacteroidota bacterium]
MAAFGLFLWGFSVSGTFTNITLFLGRGAAEFSVVGFLWRAAQSRTQPREFLILMPAERERGFYVMVSGFVLFSPSLLWLLSPLSGDPSGTVGGYFCMQAHSELW